jgi:hypothetical protein
VPSVDLSGYAKLVGGNVFSGDQVINNSPIITVNNGLRLNRGILFYNRDVDPSLPLSLANPNNYAAFELKRYFGLNNELTLVSYPIVGEVVGELYPFSVRRDNGFVAFGKLGNALYQVDSNGDINTSTLYRIGGVPYSVASSTNSGFLTSTDWNTFNNKQNTISFGAIGSTPNANGASIASSVITLQPASASFGGVVTTGTQTFGGAKTFSTVQATNFGAGISPNANFGFTGAASTTTTAPFLITPGVAYTGTQNGALWYETTNSRLRMYRNSSVSDIVTTGSNILFGGTGVRAVTATTDGSLAATTPIIAQFITDSDIITALGAATYTNNQATITPAGGKIMLQGQEYWDDTNKIKYQAVANNVVLRTPNRILKTYTALVTQTGTGAPTVTVLGENTIGTIVWTRTATGQYTGTLTGAFTASKTAVFFQSGISNNVDTYTYDFYRGTDNTVRMLTSNNGVYSDSIFVGQLRIEVYF